MTIILSQISLGKGIKDFGNRAVDATTKELSQLGDKGVLIPKHFNELSKEERDEAKRNGEIKGRACVDGKKEVIYTSEGYGIPNSIHGVTIFVLFD